MWSKSWKEHAFGLITIIYDDVYGAKISELFSFLHISFSRDAETSLVHGVRKLLNQTLENGWVGKSKTNFSFSLVI